MKLSKRLDMVSSFVDKGSKIADVGTDHGFVPIALAKRNIISYGLAMDVREGPLMRAQAHIREHGLEQVLETRLSDGVTCLKAGEADTIIIAGMGGQLIIHILEDGKRLWNQVKHWILSPQSEIEKVRDYLANQGFLIEREEMVKEEGKYYTVMKAVRGDMKSLSPWECLYGPLLIQNRHPVLIEFLEQESSVLERILEGLLREQNLTKGKERIGQRVKELRQQLTWILTAKEAMGFGGCDGEITKERMERRETDIEGL